MKRLLLTTLLLALAGGAAQAQNWFGLRTGYPLGLTVHYGIENALSNGLDLRVSANLRVRGSDVDFGVGVDALSEVSVQPPFVVYVGGGPAIDFGGRGTLIDLHGLVGGEFLFSDFDLDQLGVFAELTLGAAIGFGRPSVVPSFGGAVGFNYHF